MIPHGRDVDVTERSGERCERRPIYDEEFGYKIFLRLAGPKKSGLTLRPGICMPPGVRMSPAKWSTPGRKNVRTLK